MPHEFLEFALFGELGLQVYLLVRIEALRKVVALLKALVLESDRQG